MLVLNHHDDSCKQVLVNYSGRALLFWDSSGPNFFFVYIPILGDELFSLHPEEAK